MFSATSFLELTRPMRIIFVLSQNQFLHLRRHAFLNIHACLFAFFAASWNYRCVQTSGEVETCVSQITQWKSRRWLRIVLNDRLSLLIAESVYSAISQRTHVGVKSSNKTFQPIIRRSRSSFVETISISFGSERKKFHAATRREVIECFSCHWHANVRCNATEQKI